MGAKAGPHKAVAVAVPETKEILQALDRAWRRRTERRLETLHPAIADVHLSTYSVERLRQESFWRFILRHKVRPGITGWAQVNGRNDMTWEEKFKLDVWYVDNRSLWLDLMIIAMTMEKVVKRKGICQQGYATMSEFKGSSAD